MSDGSFISDAADQPILYLRPAPQAVTGLEVSGNKPDMENRRMIKRLIVIATATAIFTAPVMANGKIKAKSDTETKESVDENIFADDEVHGEKVEKATKIEIYFRTCKDARAAGYSRMRTGQPGYARHLDRDNDGIACE